MEPNLPLPAINVFLVEDYAPIRDRLAALIGSVEGVKIVGVADEPDAAFAGIRASQPHVVIVDLQLKSGASGLTVLKWLRQHAPDAAALVLTNTIYPQMNALCFKLGARLVLDKSMEALRVRDAVIELAASRKQA
ncbi:response regulator [Trinickia sp. LjRoot230]|uniref:response regulator n=1 Tax=Trinickia sp. LjRoot230 TaxID=3342288 RepID=UPI003ED00F7C